MMHTQLNPVIPQLTHANGVPRPDYIAAVRYPDGRRDLFLIRNADDLADARDLVISEVGDIRSVMIALRH